MSQLIKVCIEAEIQFGVVRAMLACKVVAESGLLAVTSTADIRKIA